MHPFELIVVLVLVVAALALLADRIKIPYPVLLVIAGTALSLVPGLPIIHIPPDMAFVIFFPPLLYPAALFTPWREFRANLHIILTLAIGLVVATSTAVAFIGHTFIPDFPLAAAFVLGAIISPPDAVAVTAIADEVRVPRRIKAVLEGESLVNDATALVIFRFAVAAVLGGSFSFQAAAGLFVLLAVGGIGIGLVWGWIIARIQTRLNDPAVQIAISLMNPFVTYLTAERCGVSGVLAVVTAGLYLGWRVPETLKPGSRLQLHTVWNMVSFLLEGFLFVFIGLRLPEIVHSVAGRWWQIGIHVAVVVVTVILIRIVWVVVATYGSRLLIPGYRKKDPCPQWQHVALVSWTGMRGADSLAAAIAVPFTLPNGSPFPGRDEILIVTFGVIFSTLVLQGGTLPIFIRWLGIKGDRSDEREEHAARVKANQAALAYLSQTDVRKRYPVDVIERLGMEYDDRLRQLEACTDGACGEGELELADFQKIQREALTIERRMIIALRNEGAINDDALRNIQRDLDLADARLDELV